MDSFFQRQAANGLQLTTHPEISHTHTQKKTKKVMKYLMNALPKTNSSPLNMDGWNTFSFPFGARPIFRGYVDLLVSGSVIYLMKPDVFFTKRFPSFPGI